MFSRRMFMGVAASFGATGAVKADNVQGTPSSLGFATQASIAATAEATKALKDSPLTQALDMYYDWTVTQRHQVASSGRDDELLVFRRNQDGSWTRVVARPQSNIATNAKL